MLIHNMHKFGVKLFHFLNLKYWLWHKCLLYVFGNEVIMWWHLCYAVYFETIKQFICHSNMHPLHLICSESDWFGGSALIRNTFPLLVTWNSLQIKVYKSLPLLFMFRKCIPIKEIFCRKPPFIFCISGILLLWDKHVWNL